MIHRLTKIYKDSLKDRLFEMKYSHSFQNIIFGEYEPMLIIKVRGNMLNIKTMNVKYCEYNRKLRIDFHDKKRKKHFRKWFDEHNGSNYCGMNLSKEQKENPDYKYLVNNIVWIYRRFLYSKTIKLINSYQINFKTI